MKDPWLAVTLSKFFPGLGQIYAGSFLKGSLLIIAYISLCLSLLWLLANKDGSAPLFILCLIAHPILIYANYVDANRTAKRANSETASNKRDSSTLWLLVFLASAIPFPGNGNVVGLIFLAGLAILLVVVAFESNQKSGSDNWKNAWMGVYLSQSLPGLGHFYLGKRIFGIGLVLLFIVASTALPPSLKFILILINVVIAYDAYTSAPTHLENSKIPISIVCGIFVITGIIFPSSFIHDSIVEARYIPSEAMVPTLQVNDRVLVEKVSYNFRAPERGDIVVFIPPDAASGYCLGSQNSNVKIKDAFIKRVVALPGEKVEVRDGAVLINDQPLSESYIAAKPDYELPPSVVAPNSFLVLGDNRNNSCDSRFWGTVPRENIIGRASKIWFPVARIQSLK